MIRPLFMYFGYLAKGFNGRVAWELAGMWDFCVRLALAAFAALLVYGFVGWVDQSIEEAERHGRASQIDETARARADAQREKQKADNASRKLAAAMNGGALFDRDTGEALFFQVSLQKGL